jgi:uncharacterized protein (TIGR00251 family)
VSERDGVELRVRVQPRAGANEIAGVRDGVLLVRVTAPPAGGEANAAVRKLIARRLQVGVTRVEIAKGAGSRDKVLRLHGVPDDVLAGFLKNICNTRT